MSSFVEFQSTLSEQKSKMSQPIRCLGDHLVFLIGLKNTKLVEEIEIVLLNSVQWFHRRSLKCEKFMTDRWTTNG